MNTENILKSLLFRVPLTEPRDGALEKWDCLNNHLYKRKKAFPVSEVATHHPRMISGSHWENDSEQSENQQYMASNKARRSVGPSRGFSPKNRQPFLELRMEEFTNC